jgi:transcriptional regulator with GAF, ATPase, and Fis domain
MLIRELPATAPVSASPNKRGTDARGAAKHEMLFGSGAAMADVKALIRSVADIDVPILIQGETGTGKELVARAIASSRAWLGKPFVKVNCAALPSDLFEAELFGYEQGAFTGALASKPGKFDVADGGTIFLDEIGEVPLALQAKLLQVLQDGHFSPLGSERDHHSTARVIAATNRDLQREVQAGRFREDLLFRMNVIPMRVPPLRERRQDIPMLAAFFLDRWSALHRRAVAGLSPEFLAYCATYDWPGNIRELENVVQRLVLLGRDAPPPAARAVSAARGAERRDPRIARVTCLPSATSLRAPTAAPIPRSLKRVSRDAVRQAERASILRMLRETHGNRRQAAMNLGVCYKSFLIKAKEHGM